MSERVTEIQRHVQTIQGMQSTIKSLEVDKADLFQKMVQIDKQIRAELLEKTEKEKSDIEFHLYQTNLIG